MQLHYRLSPFLSHLRFRKDRRQRYTRHSFFWAFFFRHLTSCYRPIFVTRTDNGGARQTNFSLSKLEFSFRSPFLLQSLPKRRRLFAFLARS